MSNTFVNEFKLNNMNLCEVPNQDIESDYWSDCTSSPKTLKSSNSSVSSLEEENNYWLRPYKKKHKCRLSTTQLDTGKEINYYKKNTSEYTTDLTKDSDLISSLIKKRTNSCVIGPSTHVAAFLQDAVEIRSCFLWNRKRKGRHR